MYFSGGARPVANRIAAVVRRAGDRAM